MSWSNELYNTYENNLNNVGIYDGRAILSPVAHMLANAQIEITIDGDGNFVNANIVAKDDAKTIIPVTEASEGRSSGITPHALSDTLSYIAGDYKNYVDKKEAEKAEKKFTKYKNTLKKWCDSEYSHPKVTAVYFYIAKKQMIDDLVKSGIVKIDKSGKLCKNKINGTEYEKCIVRFCVHIPGGDINDENEMWHNLDVMNQYIKYYTSYIDNKKGICYVSGKCEPIALNHPVGIVASNYKAKIISANDESGFVYRGRFVDSDEACTVGYYSTQKIHKTLSWLVAKQGFSIGTTDKRTFVCWNPKGKKVPDILNGFYGTDEYSDVDELFDLDLKSSEVEDSGLRRLLWLKINNYKNNFLPDDDIVIIALEAATTGRLSITYYKELKASDFWTRLEKWGITCCWSFTVFESGSKIPKFYIMTPNNKDIVKYAFGVERVDEGKNVVTVNDKILREHYQRILHCVIDDKPIPHDIVNALVERASRPLSYSAGNYDRLLSIACAAVRRYYIDRSSCNKAYKYELSEGGIFAMTLDTECRDRSYLFGRLLAVLEHIEYRTYEKGNGRTANAIRLQSAYINHPMQTWQTLQESIVPYVQKLNKNNSYESGKYLDLIGEIVGLLHDTDEQGNETGNKFEYLNKKLEYSYLPGYYLQRMELRNRRWKDDENREVNK